MKVTIKFPGDNPPPPPPPTVQYWRHKHDPEMPAPSLSLLAERAAPNKNKAAGLLQYAMDLLLWRSGVPEVYPYSGEVMRLTESWQRLIYGLNTTANPDVYTDMTGNKYRALLSHDRAFSNGDSNGYGVEALSDYINGIDLSAPPPKFDKVRLCGGATITGVVEGNQLHVRKGIDCLDGRQAAPPVEDIIGKFWLYFDAVNITPKATISRFPQGDGDRVFIPFASPVDIYIPLSVLVPVSGRADPYEKHW